MGIGGDAGKGQPLGLIALDKIGELVNLLAAELVRRPLGHKGPDAAPGLQSPGEYLEGGSLQNLRQVDKLHPKAGVRFVGAEAVHGLLIGQAAEGEGDVHIQNFLEQPL